MTPIDNQVVILPDPADTKIGDIILPDTAQTAPKRGTVVAIGPGLKATETGKLIPMQVNEGDHVYYSKFSGTELTVEDVTYIILKEPQILIIE